MHFEGRDLPPYAEHVPVEELRIHRVYFILEFCDEGMLIPALRPVVFVGRNVEKGVSGKLYFQDYDSFTEGRRHDVPSASDGGRIDAFFEHQGSSVYEYERALDGLMRCSIDRRSQGVQG